MRHAEIACLVLCGCSAAPDRPPIARITATPPAVLVHDNFQTSVTLDGTASASLDFPDATLHYAWQFLDDEARTDDSRSAPTLVVTFHGEQPPRVVLTVSDPDGTTGAVTRPIALTVP